MDHEGPAKQLLSVIPRPASVLEKHVHRASIKSHDINLAHEGDAMADAIVFDRGRLKNRSLYRELYGMDYRKVVEFRWLSQCCLALIRSTFARPMSALSLSTHTMLGGLYYFLLDTNQDN